MESCPKGYPDALRQRERFLQLGARFEAGGGSSLLRYAGAYVAKLACESKEKKGEAVWITII